MSSADFVSPLLDWFQRHARDLPWRRSRHPYAVWVAEIMLQQTRVETALPYYQRWMERFPTLEHLAAADEQEVLRLWEGLGYYQRARHLWQAARQVIHEFGGQIPSAVETLRRLPGVGRYTASAIASIAFDRDVPTLDGNIRRVLARLFNLDVPVHKGSGERRLWELAAQHLPPGQAALYNQALMELGALICTPRRPACERCPVASFCRAYALGVQEQRPLKPTKPARPHHLVTAAVIIQQGRVLLTQRPPQGLLGGLWEFPGGKVQPGETLEAGLRREIREELGVPLVIRGKLGIYRHAYSHFRVTLHAFLCLLGNGSQPRPLQVHSLRWASLDELERFPMGKIDRQIARQLAQTAITGVELGLQSEQGINPVKAQCLS